MASKVGTLLRIARLTKPSFRQFSGPVNPAVSSRQVEIVNVSEPPEREGPGDRNQWMVFSIIASIVVNLLVAYNASRHLEEPIMWINYPHLRKAKKEMPFGDGTHNLMHNTHCRLSPEDYAKWRAEHPASGHGH
ncbi:hypothetical protein LOTGIDRAFT_238295 [Lottia gigantea]|uniref:Uncharacterized protein n=1 Tax=Lottia gigantea TaxID=225164 RepID=V4B207_LOTGI|nr:hypothetical protein LOTGIDRAFT_238295 [Lottia gigantea]ESP01511.1 hypothetical protein LOTGIDRAFT_238295 [Lottia gigantea]